MVAASSLHDIFLPRGLSLNTPLSIGVPKLIKCPKLSIQFLTHPKYPSILMFICEYCRDTSNQILLFFTPGADVIKIV